MSVVRSPLSVVCCLFQECHALYEKFIKGLALAARSRYAHIIKQIASRFFCHPPLGTPLAEVQGFCQEGNEAARGGWQLFGVDYCTYSTPQRTDCQLQACGMIGRRRFTARGHG